VGFDRSAGHLELFGDFGVVTALEKQFSDLLLSRSQSNRFIVHSVPP
jgi:hypothetical protein